MGLQAKRLYLRLDRGQIINNDPDMVQSAALQIDVGGRDLFATTICACIKRKVAIVLPHMVVSPSFIATPSRRMCQSKRSINIAAVRAGFNTVIFVCYSFPMIFILSIHVRILFHSSS